VTTKNLVILGLVDLHALTHQQLNFFWITSKKQFASINTRNDFLDILFSIPLKAKLNH